VARALESGRWQEIHAAAHYLKNSADVVGDRELADACAALESAARARDVKAGDEAWRHCRLALARWLTEPASN
jgi:HPt (histidine-containing phosphotransfer) domain-containing protein